MRDVAHRPINVLVVTHGGLSVAPRPAFECFTRPKQPPNLLFYKVSVIIDGISRSFQQDSILVVDRRTLRVKSTILR